ncbi:MAG TPA: hypothetical protein EYH25_03115 [Thermotoga sp.]|nr:hypothetical protein [Thermotoga sp.]
MPDVVSKEHLNLAMRIREILAVYRDAEDLINIGAYTVGNNPDIDYAISKIRKINEFLKQEVYEKSTMQETIEWMKKILDDQDEAV